MLFRCGGTFDHYFITNSLLNLAKLCGKLDILNRLVRRGTDWTLCGRFVATYCFLG